MPPCPYCGAENPDGSAFCSLCLGILGKGTASGPYTTATSGRVEAARTAGEGLGSGTYVSPGDFRSVAREGAEERGGPLENTVPPRRIAAPKSIGTRTARRRGGTEAALLVLKHSLIVFFILLLVSFLLSFLILGAIYEGGTSGLSIGLGISYALEAILLIWGGYRIAAEAMERGRSWMYGMACVAGVIFFWQPLFALVLRLLITGRMVLPQTFSPLGALMAVFLFLPLGALGGWIAEKRYLG